VGELDGGAELLERPEVHVDGPGTEVVAARHGHPRPAEAGQQRAEHDDRRPHGLDQLVGRLGRDVLRHLDRDVVVVADDDPAAHGPEQLGHELDVDDAGDVAEGERPLGQHRRRHQLQHRVLGAADGYGARQRVAGAHEDAVHPPKGKAVGRPPRAGIVRLRRNKPPCLMVGSPPWGKPRPSAGPVGSGHDGDAHLPTRGASLTTVVHTAIVDDEGLASYRRPLDQLVEERAVDENTFEAVEGPVSEYRRVLAVAPAGDGTGRHAVTETVEFRIAVPVWHPLFTALFKKAYRDRQPEQGELPFWAPPQRFNARSSTILAVLCTLSLLAGYLGTLITQTMTFTADEFGASRTEQSATLAAVRVGVLGALLITAIADRRGRRKLLLLSGLCSVAFAAAGAFTPNLVALGLTQTVSRGFSTAFALLITVVAAEETPAGSRAYSVSLLAMTAGLGAGICLMVLPIADADPRAWRILYLVPLLGLFILHHAARLLPESRRYSAPHAEHPKGSHLGRLVLLSLTAFLTAMYSSPASQLQNEFLRTERGFSAAQISAFSLITGTLGFLGVVVGGRLADTRGRRLIGSLAVVAGATFTTLAYLNSGYLLWLFATVGFMAGAATIPALGVYGPELFPTAQRGRANGVIQILAVTGSSVGLLIAGSIADRSGLGDAMTVLMVAPVLVGLIVLRFYPETAGLELEELNPEDRPPPVPSVPF
jgi:MFS family permease